MFIAIGFPKSSREEGAEAVYVGLKREEMNAAIEKAIASKKFTQIGYLIRPVFNKAHMEKARVETVDCSPETNHNLRLARNEARKKAEKEAAEKTALAAAKAAETAPVAEADALKAEADAKVAAEAEQKKAADRARKAAEKAAKGGK